VFSRRIGFSGLNGRSQLVDRSITLPARDLSVAQTQKASESAPEFATESRIATRIHEPRRFYVPPIVPLVAALATGIVVDRFVEPCVTQTWFELTMISVTIAVFLIRRGWLYRAAMLVAVAAVGGGWHHYRWSDMVHDDLAWTVKEAPSPAWLRGVVRETLGLRTTEGFGAASNDRTQVTTRFVLDLTETSDGTHWRPVSGRAVMIVAGDRRELEAGQAVEGAGQIAQVGGPLNPGEFDYRSYLRAQGIRLRFTIEDSASLWRPQDAHEAWLGGLLGRVRGWSRSRLVERLDPSIAPLAAALLLGQREGIEPEVNDAFARTGTTHLLAISGLQLQALAASLLLIFRGLGLKRRAAYLIVALAMTGYAVVVGPAPSVVRATIMTTSFCLAAIAGRLDRPANTMALAALGTLALNPSYLFDIGCQLSFLAIATLIWLVPPACTWTRAQLERVRCRVLGIRPELLDLERRLEPMWRRFVRGALAKLVDGVVASTVVWLAALPLVALTFHLISPIGVLLNIPLIPLTTAALLLSGLSLVLSSSWVPLGVPLAWAAGLLLRLTKIIVLWGVAQPWGHSFVAGPARGWVLVFYALLAAAAVALSRSRGPVQPVRAGWHHGRRPWWLLGGWVAAGWLLTVAVAPRPLAPEAELLAVGHGLAILIHTPDGRNLLYDCGRLGDPSVGRRIIAPALWAKGVRRIDTVFLSHADEDHYNGLADLLDRFPIGEVRAPPGFADAANVGAARLIQLVRSRGITFRAITAPESWDRASVRFTVCHPPAGWHPETPDNARSLVMDVAFEGHHLLLTGDLEQLGLIELLAQPSPEPPPDVLLSPHHGGRSANPEWLYEWATPRLVVVSQRRTPKGAPDTLSFVERMGIPVFRTGRQGAIRMVWTADGIVASGFLDARTENDRGGDLAAQLSGWWGSAPGWSAIAALPLVSWPHGGFQLLAGIIGFALGVLACLVLAVTEIGAWALVRPRRSIRQSIELGAAGASQQLAGEPLTAMAVDGARLAGRWFPTNSARATGRTVLLLHGYAETSSDLEAHRDLVLNQCGWNVLSVDSRGYGQSEGQFATFGGREADDIRVWIDILIARFAQIDSSACVQPALWGRSMGAAIALRAAAGDDRVVALVLESPMVDIVRSTAIILRRRRIPFSNLLARLVVRRAGKLAGMPIDRPGPIESASQARCKAVIVHGTDDTLVPISEARRLADAFGSPPRWIDVAGANHTDVLEKGADGLLVAIARFLDEALASAVNVSTGDATDAGENDS
jgi:competence protein ComEC